MLCFVVSVFFSAGVWSVSIYRTKTMIPSIPIEFCFRNDMIIRNRECSNELCLSARKQSFSEPGHGIEFNCVICMAQFHLFELNVLFYICFPLNISISTQPRTQNPELLILQMTNDERRKTNKFDVNALWNLPGKLASCSWTMCWLLPLWLFNKQSKSKFLSLSFISLLCLAHQSMTHHSKQKLKLKRMQYNKNNQTDCYWVYFGHGSGHLMPKCKISPSPSEWKLK